jgi:hypothetical protein
MNEDRQDKEKKEEKGEERKGNREMTTTYLGPVDTVREG